MNILTICGYSWEIGGPARVIFDHTTAQLRLGANVTILTPLSPGERVYPVPEGARLVTVPRHSLARVLPEFSPQLTDFVRRHADEFDLLHLHGLFHHGTLLPLTLNTRARRVVTVHGTLEPWALRQGRWKKELFSRLFQKNLLDRADLIHVFHEQEAADVTRYLGHAPRRMVVCGNGIDLSAYQDMPAPGTFRRTHGVGENEKLILFLSRLNAKKGLDLLLPAFAQLAARHPDVRLVLAGPDDGYRAEAERFVAGHRLADRVLLPGMLTGSDKLAAFRDADAFVLPSYSEGYSMAALEALLTGTPALFSDRIGFDAELRREGAALLTGLTVREIRDGLEKLLTDAAFASHLRLKGPDFVRRYADIGLVAPRLYRAFEELVRTPHA